MFLFRLFFGSMAVLFGPLLAIWAVAGYFGEQPESLLKILERVLCGLTMLLVGIGWLQQLRAKPVS